MKRETLSSNNPHYCIIFLFQGFFHCLCIWGVLSNAYDVIDVKKKRKEKRLTAVKIIELMSTPPYFPQLQNMCFFRTTCGFEFRVFLPLDRLLANLQTDLKFNPLLRGDKETDSYTFQEYSYISENNELDQNSSSARLRYSLHYQDIQESMVKCFE